MVEWLKWLTVSWEVWVQIQQGAEICCTGSPLANLRGRPVDGNSCFYFAVLFKLKFFLDFVSSNLVLRYFNS